MKTFDQFKKELSEDTPANSMGGGFSVSSAASNPNPNMAGYDPILFGGKKRIRDKFAGAVVFKVKSEDYVKSVNGRKKWQRWNKSMNMEEIDNQEIRTYCHRNPGKAVIIQDENSGVMSYLIPPSRKPLSEYSATSDAGQKQAQWAMTIKQSKPEKVKKKKKDESVKEAVGDIFGPSGNEPAGSSPAGWTISDYHKSPNIMKRKLMKTKRGRELWKKYANRPHTSGGDTKSMVVSGKLKEETVTIQKKPHRTFRDWINSLPSEKKKAVLDKISVIKQVVDKKKSKTDGSVDEGLKDKIKTGAKAVGRFAKKWQEIGKKHSTASGTAIGMTSRDEKGKPQYGEKPYSSKTRGVGDEVDYHGSKNPRT